MQGWFEFKGLYFDVDSKRSDKKGHKSNKYSIQASFLQNDGSTHSYIL